MPDIDETKEPETPFTLFDVADFIGIVLTAGGVGIALLALAAGNVFVSWIAAGLVPAGFGLMLTARIGRALNQIARANAAILTQLRK